MVAYRDIVSIDWMMAASSERTEAWAALDLFS